MNEEFKYYTDKGFIFSFFTFDGVLTISVQMIEGGYNPDGYFSSDVYQGDNLDHALAACDLYLED